MSNVNTAPTPAADQEIDQRLAVVQEAVSVLANPIPVLEDIEAELDILNDGEADPGALNAIHENAITLLDSQQRLATAFMTTLELAKALKDQREQARQTLADLQRAVEECDVENPDIEALAESIREEQDEMLWYFFEEMLIDHLVDDTPLTYQEGNHFITVLREIDAGDVLIAELKEWIERAYEVLYPPVPDSDN